MEKFYAINKLDNGNVVFTDTRTMTIIRVFNPSASIERMDENRIKITNNIGDSNGFVFDYRKIDTPACSPYIETDYVGQVLYYLSEFFFLTKSSTGYTKILNYSFSKVHIFTDNKNAWHTINSDENVSDTLFHNPTFYPVPSGKSTFFHPIFQARLGKFGVCHNALPVNSFIKRLVVDVNVASSDQLTPTDFEFCIFQHRLLPQSILKAGSYTVKVGEQKLILHEKMANLPDGSQNRKIYGYKKTNATLIDKNARISLFIRSNLREGDVFRDINIELELAEY